MKSILALVASPPQDPNTWRAFDLARQLRNCHHQVTLCLIQDAVLCALNSSSLVTSAQLDTLSSEGMTIYYLEPDLALRGFSSQEVKKGLRPTDYGRLVDLISEHDQTMGAF